MERRGATGAAQAHKARLQWQMLVAGWGWAGAAALPPCRLSWGTTDHLRTDGVCRTSSTSCASPMPVLLLTNVAAEYGEGEGQE